MARSSRGIALAAASLLMLGGCSGCSKHGTPNHAISGTVSGAIRADVTVALAGPAAATATTDATGAYLFKDLADGSYTVTPSRAGFTFSPPSLAVEVSGADATARDFTAVATPALTWSISGTVAGATSAGVVVSLGGAGSASATTDAAGFYSFSGLASGDYTVTPRKSGFLFTPSTIAVPVSGASVGSQDFTAEVDASPGFTISGVLSGAATAGVTVWLGGDAWASTTTDASGRYAFSGLQTGTYAVTPIWPGTVFSPSCRHVNVMFEDKPGNDFTATAATATTYAIFGAVAGDTAADVLVLLSGDASSSATTDASGRFLFPALANGTYVVTLRKSGFHFTPQSLVVTVSGANVARGFAATATTGPIYSISGTVSGATSSGVLLTLYAPGAPSSTITDPSGNYSFGDLPNATYSVNASKDGYEFTPVSLTVTVNGANATGRNITSRAVHRITGTVSGASAGLAVLLGGAASSSTTTDPSGHYVFERLENGSYTVTPRANGLQLVPSSRVVTLSGADATADFTASAARCSSDHWCWESSPFQRTLESVWGSSASDVWAAGEGGMILHWDGGSWSSATSGTTSRLGSIWGGAANDVWAVGESGAIRRWDGRTWAGTPSGTTRGLEGVWGAATNDVWAVGEGGTILHWDGGSWSSVASGTARSLESVWGAAANDVWAVGEGGTILHWDGGSWARATSATTDALHDVWGGATNDVWAVGDNGTIQHWDGSAWSSVPSAPSTLRGVWGTAADDVFAVGDAGAILHWDGSAWAGLTRGRNGLRAAWGSAGNAAWAVGENGTILRWNGGAWSDASGSTAQLADVWGAAVNDVWAVGEAGTILHWSGSGWASVPSGTHCTLAGVWGSAANDVWAVGAGGLGIGTPSNVILHWDGTAWSKVPAGTTAALFSVWGSAADDVWAVGDNGTIVHWNGSVWVSVPSGTTASLSDVWGSARNDVRVAAESYYGASLHWDGNGWSLVNLPAALTPPSGLFGLWGEWAVGASRYVLRWNGSAWAVVDSGTTGQLLSVWGSSATDVWAVGASGTMIRWNGSAWVVVDSGTTRQLGSVWGSSATDAWAVGDYGTILRYRP